MTSLGVWLNFPSMPWKETHTVSERHHLIDLVVYNDIAVPKAARTDVRLEQDGIQVARAV